MTLLFPIKIDFNPRPSVRGDRGATKRKRSLLHFNPRPSVRGDFPRFARGATKRNFNPRPSVRGDLVMIDYLARLGAFQSTPLREGRPVERETESPPSYFNPRPSVRGDEFFAFVRRFAVTFQSTPLREGRLSSLAAATFIR